jgi:predicted DNA-binding transcriptional regulator AlpA
MPMRILTEEEVRERKLAGASTGTLQALMKDPEDPFPQPISITTRLRGWNESRVDAWLERREQRLGHETERKADIAARMPHARAAAAAAVGRRRGSGQAGAAGDAS